MAKTSRAKPANNLRQVELLARRAHERIRQVDVELDRVAASYKEQFDRVSARHSALVAELRNHATVAGGNLTGLAATIKELDATVVRSMATARGRIDGLEQQAATREQERQQIDARLQFLGKKLDDDVGKREALSREISGVAAKVNEVLSIRTGHGDAIAVLRKDTNALRTEMNAAAEVIEKQKVAISQALVSADSLAGRVNMLSSADGAHVGAMDSMRKRLDAVDANCALMRRDLRQLIEKLEAVPKDQPGVSPQVWKLVEDRILRSVDHAVAERTRNVGDQLELHATRLTKAESAIAAAAADCVDEADERENTAFEHEFVECARGMLPPWQFDPLLMHATEEFRAKQMPKPTGTLKVDTPRMPITEI